MLSHSENQSTAHGPTRYSSLRHVTSTNEQPDSDVSGYGDSQTPASDQPPQLSDQISRKFFTLGVHDGPSTPSTALLDLRAFAGKGIGGGIPIIIAPASEAGLAVEEESMNAINEVTPQGSLGSEPRNGKSKHLFVAEPMDPDMINKNPGVQVCIFIVVSTFHGSTLILLDLHQLRRRNKVWSQSPCSSSDIIGKKSTG